LTLSPLRPQLRKKLLVALCLAWPLGAAAQTPAGAPLRTIPDAAFQQWLREDNQIIEGIVQSLKHIDTLVGEIERMVRQLPDFAAVPPAQAKPATPPPPPAPVAAATETALREPPGVMESWGIQLAGAALLALLAFWLGRRQGGAQTAGKTVALATPPVPTPAPSPAPLAEKRAAEPAPSVVPSETVEPVATAEQAPAAPPASAPVSETLETPSAPASTSEAPSVSIESPSRSQADQALELAEIMLSMGLGHGATQTLIEQIRNEPKQALRHWLKLLEIYRKNGQQAEFERSAEELRLHFNVRPEDWHARSGTQTLEDFPHIAKRLTELWGKPDCLVYMQNLLDDNRGGARSGFPQAVAEELLLLTAIMREVCGFLPD